MRKTFEECSYEQSRVTWMVGDLNLDQDDNTPDNECYWLNIKQVTELLLLVRKQTIKECLNSVALILDGSPGLKQFEEAFNKLPKDSIEL